ncbi:hypothetical protein DFR62_0872 [Planococcus citreus]|uniref:Uncharacterized protein n=1 Tax=Planococcus citreus TaxID=1373 RepID=A0A497YUZ5_9BACL|nr:hypothetical protein DFR62_0872 [Planococcus citreus]
MTSVFLTGVFSLIFTWVLPIAIIIALVVLFKKVNRLEKKLDK